MLRRGRPRTVLCAEQLVDQPVHGVAAALAVPEPSQPRCNVRRGVRLQRNDNKIPERQSIRFRLARRTCAPCGPSARVASPTKSRKIPARKTQQPLCFLAPTVSQYSSAAATNAGTTTPRHSLGLCWSMTVSAATWSRLPSLVTSTAHRPARHPARSPAPAARPKSRSPVGSDCFTASRSFFSSASRSPADPCLAAA